MKKILLFLIICFSQIAITSGYVNPGVTSLNTPYGGGPNQGTFCSGESVITTVNANAPGAGNMTCEPHNYYGSDYRGPVFTQGTVSTTIIVNCANRDRARGFQVLGVDNYLTCQRWDDGIPTVLDNYLSNGNWTNVSSVIRISATDPSADGGTTTGTIQSRLKEIRYCEGANNCIPSIIHNVSPLSVNTFMDINVGPDRDNYLNYQAIDDAGNISLTGSIQLRIEDNLPQVSNLDYFDGWTNRGGTQNPGDLAVTFDLSDNAEPIESGLSKFTLQVRTSSNNPDFTSWSSWVDVSDLSFVDAPVSGSSQSITYNYTPANNTAYEFQVKVWDIAGNDSGWIQSAGPKITKIDQTPPHIPSDVAPFAPGDLLADQNFLYGFNINVQGGSPVDSITFIHENVLSDTFSGPITDTSSPWEFNWDISKVDDIATDPRKLNGSREYGVQIRELRDLAGNVSVGGHTTLLHDVYANTSAGNIATRRVSVNPFGSAKIADGHTETLTIELEDQYGNDIIPATGINRNVNFDFFYNNDLYSNQYNEIGDAIYMRQPLSTDSFSAKFPFASSSINGSNVESNDKDYDFDFQVYAPTYRFGVNDGRQLVNPNSDFVINSINVDISGNIGANNNVGINGSNIDFEFTPLYSSVFRDEGVKRYGFIEGIDQETKIDYSNTSGGSEVGVLSHELYLEFGQIVGLSNVEHLKYNLSPFYTGSLEGHQGSYTDLYSVPGNVTQTLITNLSQETTNIAQTGNAYLASIIKYELGGNTIVYPSEIIGRENYFAGTSTGGVTTQIGIKVLGKTYSEKQLDINSSQASEVQKLDAKVTKSFLKRNIRSSVYSLIRNIEPVISCGTGCRYKELGDVIFYQLDGGTIDYSSIPAAYSQKRGKTVLIVGGDLIIEENDLNAVSGNGVHGIIVLKDGVNGGNILIDDDVLSIEAAIYVDKSILPYESSTISPEYGILTQSSGISYFKNQLYIYGSIFSNNTIGGARGTPPFCPYYIPKLSCDLRTAQQYDLNFLRRYYIYDSNGDGSINSIDEPANGGTGTLLKTDESYPYPLVVEYNGLIQMSPPPLFAK